MFELRTVKAFNPILLLVAVVLCLVLLLAFEHVEGVVVVPLLIRCSSALFKSAVVDVADVEDVFMEFLDAEEDEEERF